jgi:hypothetical protein
MLGANLDLHSLQTLQKLLLYQQTAAGEIVHLASTYIGHQVVLVADFGLVGMVHEQFHGGLVFSGRYPFIVVGMDFLREGGDIAAVNPRFLGWEGRERRRGEGGPLVGSEDHGRR